jgi:hypothetical protein
MWNTLFHKLIDDMSLFFNVVIRFCFYQVYFSTFRATQLTDWLSAWNRVHPEKLTGPRLLKKFPALCETWRFITSFTRAHQWFQGFFVRVTWLMFYGEDLLAPRPALKLGDHPLSAVCDCLYSIFAVTLHIWRPLLHLQPEATPCSADRDPLIATQLIRML